MFSHLDGVVIHILSLESIILCLFVENNETEKKNLCSPDSNSFAKNKIYLYSYNWFGRSLAHNRCALISLRCN